MTQCMWPTERFTLYEWLWEVTRDMRLLPRSLSLAYSLCEEFIDRGVALEDLQLYGAAALCVAEKYERNGDPAPNLYLVRLADDLFTLRQLQDAELRLAAACNWRLNRHLTCDDAARGPHPPLVCAVLHHADMLYGGCCYKDALHVAESMLGSCTQSRPTLLAHALGTALYRDKTSGHGKCVYRVAAETRLGRIE